MDTLHMFTDGACSGNPGPGGYAVIVMYDKPESFHGYEIDTTNNRMELRAVVEAVDLAIATIRSGEYDNVCINVDSAYVYNAITQGWVKRWVANKWKNKAFKQVKNADLWQEFVKMSKSDEYEHITFMKVRGHSGNKCNEAADAIAVKMRDIAVKKRMERDPDYKPPHSYIRGRGYKQSAQYKSREKLG